MTPKDLIDYFGTITGIARAFGCKPSSVSEWIESGNVPEGRQYQAELATNGRLRASRPADRREAA